MPDAPDDLAHACSCCGDPAVVRLRRYGWVCVECWQELTQGIVPDMGTITSTSPHVPAGVNLIRRSRTPGTGEGRDYFGNHT